MFSERIIQRKLLDRFTFLFFMGQDVDVSRTASICIDFFGMSPTKINLIVNEAKNLEVVRLSGQEGKCAQDRLEYLRNKEFNYCNRV